jgi:hypothetical protein
MGSLQEAAGAAAGKGTAAAAGAAIDLVQLAPIFLKWWSDQWPAMVEKWKSAQLPLLPAPVAKLSGKQWIGIAYERRADELRPDLVTITDASRLLAAESATAADCAKPLSASYIENELRERKIWPKKPRGSPER